MSGEPMILVLDAGTSSVRALLYSAQGHAVATAQREITQYYPQPGWVEHDPIEIWERTLACARDVVASAGAGAGAGDAGRIVAIGIANQRETAVAWDKTSGTPLTRAIVWQDRRTADACTALRDAGHEPAVSAATGLVLDPYFSATKWRWMLDHVPAVAAAGDRLALGTVESWLVWKLSGGAHVTDASNASRTLLLPLDGASFDRGLCDLFGVPHAGLPHVVDMAGRIAACDPQWLGTAIPICGLAGDQQAAAIGQGCREVGATKATFGTGAFILTATGTAPLRSSHRLLTTVLSQVDGHRHYAVEGSVFVAGSMIKWLRDGLGWIDHARDTEALARENDNGGVTVVPALAGLGAPYWRPDATGAIFGLTLGTQRAQIVRAALESISHQCHDLQRAFAADGAPWRSLRIDGGMSPNNWLAQDLADILELPVERPADVESTARGAAILAAVGFGLLPGLDDTGGFIPDMTCFAPAMPRGEIQTRLRAWSDAVERVLKAS